MKGESAAKPGGGGAPLEQTNRILYHRDHDDDAMMVTLTLLKSAEF